MKNDQLQLNRQILQWYQM